MKEEQEKIRIGECVCIVKLEVNYSEAIRKATKLHGKSNLITSNIFDRVDS